MSDQDEKPRYEPVGLAKLPKWMRLEVAYCVLLNMAIKSMTKEEYEEWSKTIPSAVKKPKES